jgi:hypothetical protein
LRFERESSSHRDAAKRDLLLANNFPNLRGGTPAKISKIKNSVVVRNSKRQ